LVLLYRVLGTLSVLIGFPTDGAKSTRGPELIYALVAAYVAYSMFVIYRIGKLAVSAGAFASRLTKQPEARRAPPRYVGRGEVNWLDAPIFYYSDIAIAFAANLVLASLLRPGAVYLQYTDIFGPALISAVVLWTARRGGWRGLRLVLLIPLVELGMAFINRMPLHQIDWQAIATRTVSGLTGLVIAVGLVRLLLNLAEGDERSRADEAELKRLSRSHDEYKDGLRQVREIVRVGRSDALERVEQTVDNALDADRCIADFSTTTVEGLVGYAIVRARPFASPSFDFVTVDAVHEPVLLPKSADAVGSALQNLCNNAARHSGGRRATIRWKLHDENRELVITVRDDGVGMRSTEASGGGLAVARHKIARVGGSMDLSRGATPGSKWTIRIYQPQFEVDR
jgi:signal transduction histidine kinase